MADGRPTVAGGRSRSDSRPGEDRLPADLAPAIADLLARRPDLSLDIRWEDSLPSTMDLVATAAEARADEGLVIGAETQTAGRGRRGRTWISPPGAGLYFSYLARPTRDVGLLTLAAGVAVRAGLVRATGLAPDLKWPNDVMIGARKLAGVLAEAARVGTPDVAVSIGVGINVRPSALPPEVAARATCLDEAAGRPVDRGHVLAAVIEALADTLAGLSAGAADDILRSWRAASPASAGTHVAWTDASGPRAGVTAGIDDSGALLVQTPTNLERIIAGEIAWDLERRTRHSAQNQSREH